MTDLEWAKKEANKHLLHYMYKNGPFHLLPLDSELITSVVFPPILATWSKEKAQLYIKVAYESIGVALKEG